MPEPALCMENSSAMLNGDNFQDGEPESKQAMQKKALANAGEQLLRERSWWIMQGWEADSAQIPSVENLLETVR